MLRIASTHNKIMSIKHSFNITTYTKMLLILAIKFTNLVEQSDVVAYLSAHGVRRVVVGHKPVGGEPLVVKA